MNKQEFYDIAINLEKYHEIFSALWKITHPQFSTQVETAAVCFNKDGNCINFLINPNFWGTIDEYNKEFVICHELLHVILIHGIRSKQYRDKYSPDIINICLDLSVNHLLTQLFKFNRFFIKNWHKLCWADTVLQNYDLEPNKSFEYYIDKLPLSPIFKQQIEITDHDYLKDFDEKVSNRIKNILDTIMGTSSNSEDNKNILDQTLSKLEGGQYPGSANISELRFLKNKKLKILKKWESVLHKYMRHTEHEHEHIQWIRANRRISFIKSDILLPSESEIIDRDLGKYKIWLFLDCSGSCYELYNLFNNASKTFNPNKFEVQKFGHSTFVSKNINDCGGGTSFSCIENYIQSQITQGKITKYPDAIFHFTDGEGYRFETAYPSRWYVFLTPKGSEYCYPKGTNFFKLSDFVQESQND